MINSKSKHDPQGWSTPIYQLMHQHHHALYIACPWVIDREFYMVCFMNKRKGRNFNTQDRIAFKHD